MKITAWNTEGRLSRFSKAGRRGSPEQIVEVIKRLDGDIIFLPEAFDGARPLEKDIQKQLSHLGYETITASYSERKDRQRAATVDPHIMLLSRMEIVKCEKIRPGGIRTMIMTDIVDASTGQTVRVFGIHLDDRTEENRLRQLNDLVPLINNSPLPVIVMGDFNAMHASTLTARLFRNQLARVVIHHMPHAVLRDVLQRLSAMAIGETLRRLQKETNLVNADKSSRPTTTPKMRGQEWLPSIRIAQIDHIFVSPELMVEHFGVSKDGGSDHRAISAIISHL